MRLSVDALVGDNVGNLLRNQKAVWFNGLRNKWAGKWLETVPSYKKLMMPSKLYRACIRNRMFLKAEDYMENVHCTCASHTPLDKYGHHLIACAKYGSKTKMHDDVKVELGYILRYAGKRIELEPRNRFVRGGDGAPASYEDMNKRPDIAIRTQEGVLMEELLDVTVVSTVHYAHGVLAHVNAEVCGVSARHGHREKMIKYGALCAANDLGFTPIVFESNGYVHPDTVVFLQKLAKTASAMKRIDGETLMNYFMKLLSIRLQIGIAQSIVFKMSNILGQDLFDPAINDAAILNDADPLI